MKKLLLSAISLMAASSMLAQTGFESAQNFKVQDANLDVQTEQLDFSLLTEQAQGLVRNNSKIAEVGLEREMMLTPEASAFYYQPSGAFYFGASTQGRFMSNTFLLAPTFAELEWPNATGDWATTFEWKYVDPINSTTDRFVILNSTERNLKTKSEGLVIYPAPLLTAKGSGVVSTFGIGAPAENIDIEKNAKVLYGGSVGSLAKRGMLPMNVGASLFDVPKLDMRFYVMNAAQDEFLAGKDAVSQRLKIKGFMNAVDKPASPYFIDQEGIWAFAKVVAADDAEFTCTLYKISFVEVTLEDGTTKVLPKMGEEICHSTRPFSELKQNMRQLQVGHYTGAMVFNNFVTEDEYGYEADVVPIIDSAIAVVISGFQSVKVRSFELATNAQPYDEYNRPDLVANSRLVTHYFALSETFDPTLSIAAPMFDNFTLAIMMDACFPWLRSDDTAFEAPVAGGNKSFNFTSYFGPMWRFVIDGDYDNFKSVNPQEMNTSVNLNDWLSARVSRGPQLTLTADPLPEGAATRTAKVTVVDLAGMEQDIWVAQHDPAGVEDANAAFNFVKVVNGNFEISSASADAVEVFNVAGQKVADAQFEGQCVLDAQNLANGLYIVKFNDNTVVKIVK